MIFILRRMVVTSWILLYSLTLFASPSKPASLSGEVSDPQGAKTADVLITLYNRGNGERFKVSSNTSGGYRFQKLRPGKYILEAEARDFAPVTVPNLRLEAGMNLVQDIILKLAVRREEVVVTASGTPQSADEISKVLTVISGQEIQQRGEISIAETLRPVPGLRVQQRGSPGTLMTIRIRGLRNEDTGFLIDGLRFRDPAAPQGDATGFLSDLLVTNTDRLEVLRGSASSLYGTNAIGGVVNIITAEGGGRTRGSLLTEGGSLGHLRGRARLSGGIREDHLTYSLGLTHLNISKGVDGDDPFRNTSGQGRLRLHLSPTSNLSARLFGAKSFLKLNTSPESAPPPSVTGVVTANPLAPNQLRRYEAGTPRSQLDVGLATFIPAVNDPDKRRAADFVSAAFVFKQQPITQFGYSLSYHSLNTNRTNYDGPGGIGFQPNGTVRSEIEGRSQTFNARTNLGLGSSHLINAGYEFENERFINLSFPEVPINNSSADVSQRANTFHIQDQVQLLQGKLQLSAAFRVQWFSLQNPLLSPSNTAPYKELTFSSPPTAYTGDSSISYFISATRTKIRTHVGNGYRSPSLFERFGTSFSSFGYATYGDPRLRPDRSIAVDLGLDQTLLRDRLQTSATYFYTRLQENIVFDVSGVINPLSDPFGRFFGYRNTRGGLARGLELSVTARPLTSTNLRLAYTYTNADQREPLVGDILQSFVVPKNQWSFLITQWIGPRFFVNLDLVLSSNYLAPLFNSENFSSRVFKFDGMTKADLGTGYRLPLTEFQSLRFFSRVDNLLDKKYYENGFRNPGVSVVAGIELEF